MFIELLSLFARKIYGLDYYNVNEYVVFRYNKETGAFISIPYPELNKEGVLSHFIV